MNKNEFYLGRAQSNRENKILKKIVMTFTI